MIGLALVVGDDIGGHLPLPDKVTDVGVGSQNVAPAATTAAGAVKSHRNRHRRDAGWRGRSQGDGGRRTRIHAATVVPMLKCRVAGVVVPPDTLSHPVREPVVSPE